MKNLYYISENLQKLKKEFKVTNEEILKIGNLCLLEVAEQYYRGNFKKEMFEKKFKQQIEEVRCFEN